MYKKLKIDISFELSLLSYESDSKDEQAILQIKQQILDMLLDKSFELEVDKRNEEKYFKDTTNLIRRLKVDIKNGEESCQEV